MIFSYIFLKIYYSILEVANLFCKNFLMNEHNRTKTTLIPSYTLTIVLFFPIFIWISIRVSTRQVSNPVCVDSSIRTACEIILWANTRRKKNYVFAFLYTLPWNLLLILIWISIRVSTNQVRNSVGVESRFRTCLRNYPMNQSLVFSCHS